MCVGREGGQRRGEGVWGEAKGSKQRGRGLGRGKGPEERGLGRGKGPEERGRGVGRGKGVKAEWEGEGERQGVIGGRARMSNSFGFLNDLFEVH